MSETAASETASPEAASPPALAPVWPGPCLVVPMTIDCLLVGTPDQAGSVWAVTGTNYANLFNGLQATAPFTPGPAPTTGAHLTWAIPAALRQGQGQNGSTEAVQFPLVPNRWAVLRAQYDATGGAPVLTGWVIQADLLSPWQQTNPSVSQYPDPTNPGAVVQIGGAVPMGQWTGAAGPAQPFLRAVGPGDVSWAVAYDNIRNALSFHDSLSAATPGMIGYAVTGWYADPMSDPLSGLPTGEPSQWLNALAGFEWTAGDSTVAGLAACIADWTAWQKAHGLATMPFDPANVTVPGQLKTAITTWANWRQSNGVVPDQPALPRQLLCHGFIGQIAWQGTGHSYGTGAPGGGLSYPALAVGNTAVEATSAWLANQLVAQDHLTQADVAAIEQAIVAFQKGLLHELGTDPASTEAHLQAAEFADLTGGSRWVVVRATAKDGSAEASGNQTIPLTAPQTTALTALAALQVSRNQTAAILLSQQKELFSLLFKQGAMDRTTPAPIRTRVNNAIGVMRSAVQASQTSLAALDGQIAAQQQTLIAALGAEYELRQIDAPPAHQPVDPVLLVAAASADTKFAPPGVYDKDAALFCRFTGETIDGIEITGPAGPSAVGPADLLNSAQLPQGLALPKEVQDLWLETLFLDPGAAAFLARSYFAVRGQTPTQAEVASLAGTVRTQQAAVWQNAARADRALRQVTAEAAGFSGTLPSPVAVVLWGGQPWSPIFVDWKMSWIPSATTPAGTFTNWQLGANDFAWLGGAVQPLPRPLIYQGRTVLNAKIARDVGGQFAQFTDGPDYASLPRFVRDALSQMADLLKNADLLTQSVGGFTEQLLTKVIAPNQTVTGADQTLLGSSPIGFQPVPGTYTADAAYFPFRAGHAQLLDLWVVDSYGQILRGKDPNLGPNAPVPNLILAQTVATPGDASGSFIQLPPRIAQPSSAALTLVDAADDGIPANSADATSPICGWLVPNHLDTSLMVFDADGTMLGSVIEVQPDVVAGMPQTGLRWDAPPGSDVPLGSPPAIANAHLLGVVSGLLAKGLAVGGAALDSLMNHIDSTLWLTAPLGLPKGGVSLLLGPPIAVVRGQLGLSLSGLPSYDQSWLTTGTSYVGSGNTYQPMPVPLQAVPVPVRVGEQSFNENGVLGYFTSDDYSRFYAVHGSGTQTAALRAARRQARRNLRSLVGATVTLADDGGYVTEDHLVPLLPDATPVSMTILVDPRGSIPVVAGLVPPNWETLPNGPVARALAAMKAAFRVGPLLVADPASVRMPLPSEMRGQWSWTARTDVTTWRAEEKVQTQDATASFTTSPPRLSEGWLILSGALGETAKAVQQFRAMPSRSPRSK
jgi:hypothetical protein